MKTRLGSPAFWGAFWGLDSFANMELALRGEDPVAHADLERWRDLPASAHRPQRT